MVAITKNHRLATDCDLSECALEAAIMLMPPVGRFTALYLNVPSQTLTTAILLCQNKDIIPVINLIYNPDEWSLTAHHFIDTIDASWLIEQVYSPGA